MLEMRISESHLGRLRTFRVELGFLGWLPHSPRGGLASSLRSSVSEFKRGQKGDERIVRASWLAHEIRYLALPLASTGSAGLLVCRAWECSPALGSLAVF